MSERGATIRERAQARAVRQRVELARRDLQEARAQQLVHRRAGGPVEVAPGDFRLPDFANADQVRRWIDSSGEPVAVELENSVWNMKTGLATTFGQREALHRAVAPGQRISFYEAFVIHLDTDPLQQALAMLQAMLAPVLVHLPPLKPFLTGLQEPFQTTSTEYAAQLEFVAQQILPQTFPETDEMAASVNRMVPMPVCADRLPPEWQELFDAMRPDATVESTFTWLRLYMDMLDRYPGPLDEEARAVIDGPTGGVVGTRCALTAWAREFVLLQETSPFVADMTAELLRPAPAAGGEVGSWLRQSLVLFRRLPCSPPDDRVPIRDRLAKLASVGEDMDVDGGDAAAAAQTLRLRRVRRRQEYARMAYDDFANALQSPGDAPVYSDEELATCDEVGIVMAEEEARYMEAHGIGRRVEVLLHAFDTTALAHASTDTVNVMARVRPTPAWFIAAVRRAFDMFFHRYVSVAHRIPEFVPATYTDEVLEAVAIHFAWQARASMARDVETQQVAVITEMCMAMLAGELDVEHMRELRARHVRTTRQGLEAEQLAVLAMLSKRLSPEDMELAALVGSCGKVGPTAAPPGGGQPLNVVVGGVTPQQLFNNMDDGLFHLLPKRVDEVRAIGQLVGSVGQQSLQNDAHRAALAEASGWFERNAEALLFDAWDVEAKLYPYIVYLYWLFATKCSTGDASVKSFADSIIATLERAIRPALPSTQRWAMLLEDAKRPKRAHEEAAADSGEKRPRDE